MTPMAEGIDRLQLATLAEVARWGSFERAAERLGVTPSAVSQRVRALEERFGTLLVVRGTPCRATDHGRKLVAHHEDLALLDLGLARCTR